MTPWATLVRGLRLSPELRVGLGLTVLLAVIATAGRVVAPVAIQLTIDRGLLGADGPSMERVIRYVVFGAGALVVTAGAGAMMNARLARVTETALSALRVRAFRHIHDLSMLHQASEHRGALVSRVTADVDEISRFMQWGGLVLLVNVGQLALATVVMAVYSPVLTLVVIGTFAPLVAILRAFQRRLSVAYNEVRRRVGDLLTAIAESVVGAPTIRAFGVEQRTNDRIDGAVTAEFRARYRAGKLAAGMFSSGEVFAAAATAAVVVIGAQLGLGGGLSEGRLVAFLFLVTLFVAPVQVATEVLDQAQTAIAGWRRVLEVLDRTPDVADPAARSAAIPIPSGPIRVEFRGVEFRYPRTATREGDPHRLDPPALRDLDLVIPPQRRLAVVGETGSGKTTFAKLLTRLMDPTRGEILVNGVPLDRVAFAELRRRIVMVPQDGFLFDGSVADNVRHGRDNLTDDGVLLAFTELGVRDWIDSLPQGLATPVGERGESLSVGERQLVALARAYVANPDLLVLDEATSAIDPATETRIQRALESLTRGRTALAIAHRLSTAEVADEVIVFDDGRVVQRGPHAALAEKPGVYADLYGAWRAPQQA